MYICARIMVSDPVIQRTALQLQQQWGLNILSGGDLDSLRIALAVHLEWMLGNEVERLVQAMYRLDVPEKLFHQAMRLPSRHEQAEALAELVLVREFKRAETWLKYSSPRKDSDD